MFQQGAFTNSANATPEQIARKREMIAALMPRFGQAKYIGEGIGQLAYGIGAGLSAKKLDQQEQEGRAGAQDRFSSLFSGIQGRAQPGGFSVLGSMPADPNEALAADTMQALGKGGTMQPDAVVSGLVQRGMPEHIAQGFATNFKDESGFNTAAVGDNGNAFGLAQWNGPRKAALEQFAAERGKPASDMNVQLDFLMAELQGPESAAWSKISGAPDAGSAAAAVLNHFERPAEEHRARREAQYTGGAPMGGPQGAAASVPIDALYGILSDPWQSPENKAIAQSMIQQQQQIMDPAYKLGIEKARLELDALKNPQQPETLTERTALAQAAGLQQGTDEYRTFMLTGNLPGQGEMPADFQSLKLRAEAAGLKEGTKEYQDFMRQGSEGAAPAAFLSLDMQAQAAGFAPGTPEYKQFMATRGSGLVAQASAEGKAAGENMASAGADMQAAQNALDMIESVKNDPNRERGTGKSAFFNWIPGTAGYDFENKVSQVKSGAFLTAIQALRGLGALSNTEGDAATKAITRLDTATSEQAFMEALADYEKIVRQGYDRAAQRQGARSGEGKGGVVIDGYQIEEMQ